MTREIKLHTNKNIYDLICLSKLILKNGEIQEPEEVYLKKESRLLNFAGIAEYGEPRFYCENL